MLFASGPCLQLDPDNFKGSSSGIVSQVDQAVVEDRRASGCGLEQHQAAVLDHEAGIRPSDPVAPSGGGPTQAHLFRIALLSDKSGRTGACTEAERAVLAITEVGCRLADRADPIPDILFDEAAKHYDEPALATLVVAIANINTWNRLNVLSGQVTGEWVAQWVA